MLFQPGAIEAFKRAGVTVIVAGDFDWSRLAFDFHRWSVYPVATYQVERSSGKMEKVFRQPAPMAESLRHK